MRFARRTTSCLGFSKGDFAKLLVPPQAVGSNYMASIAVSSTPAACDRTAIGRGHVALDPRMATALQSRIRSESALASQPARQLFAGVLVTSLDQGVEVFDSHHAELVNGGPQQQIGARA